MAFLPRSAPCIRLPSWSRPSPGFSLQSRIRLFLARLREFVWVAASPPWWRRRQVRAPERASRGHGAVDVVGPVALSGARPAVGTKECTQIGKNDLSEPFRGIRVHCCAVVDRHGGAGVYTDRRKRLLGNRSEVFVYTVATRGSRGLRREPHRVARVPQPPWRAGGAHSVAVSPLVGKTGSARAAPPLGWRLHRGINPH